MAFHHFCTEDAAKYGIEEAVLLNNIGFWCTKNLANRQHIHDGNVWTYNTAEAFAELFPYLAQVKSKSDKPDAERNAKKKKIERLLASLEKQGAIISGNYNKSSYDRKKWYALANPELLSKYGVVSPEALKTLMRQNCRLAGDLENTDATNLSFGRNKNVASLTDNKQDNKNQNILESDSDESDAPDDSVFVSEVESVTISNVLMFISLWKLAAISNRFPVKIKSGSNGSPIEFFGKPVREALETYLNYCSPAQLVKAMEFYAHERTASDEWRDPEHGKFEAGIVWFLNDSDLLIDCLQSVVTDAGIQESN